MSNPPKTSVLSEREIVTQQRGNRGGIHAIRVRAMWRCSYPIGGLLFRGRLLNLSLNGCYIETALLNLEHGTQVEVYFVTNQLQFRVLEILLRSAGSGELGSHS